MKNEEILYTQWKAYRRQIHAPDSFSKKVMAGVEYSYSTPTQDREWGHGFRQRILPHPWAQWGTGVGLVLLGLFRLFYVMTGLFRTSLLMP